MVSYFVNLWNLFVDMSFYIVIGLLFTGLLHAFVKKEVILKHIGQDNTSSVVKASVFGVPLPLCSCGVVPTAMYLGKSGASKGAVVSFLTSTPQTGVDSLIATYGMMGPLFAVYRAVSAFFSGIFAGVMTNVLCKHHEISYGDAPTSCGCCSHEQEQEHHDGHAHEEHTCGCSHEDVHHDTNSHEKHSCGCCSHEHEHHNEHSHEEHSCDCCSHEHEHHNEHSHEEHSCGCCSHEHEYHNEHSHEEHSCGCCSHEHEHTQEQPHSLVEKLKIAIQYGFGEFLDEIAGHFVIGLLIAALITTVLPENILSTFSNPIVSMLLMIVVGIPMYICSTASIPIAVSLMMKGVSPGAAFVFLFAGPVTNMASLTILLQTLGKKVVAIYLSAVAICAIFFGLLFDYIIQVTGYDEITTMLHPSHEHEMPLYMTVVAVLFGALVLKSLLKQVTHKKTCNCTHS